jgi:hypothetical protein
MAAPHLGIAGLMPRSVERLVDLMGAPYGGRTMKQLFLRDARCGAPRRPRGARRPRALTREAMMHVLFM